MPKAEGIAGSPLEAGLETIGEHFIKPLPRDQLETMALAALLERLDPYSHYLAPAEMDAFTSELDASFAGIGVNLWYEDPSGYPRVSYLLRGGVAGKVDLRRNDLLLAVDGKDLKGQGWEQVASKLRGRAGTTLTLKLRREGVAEPITLSMQRVQIDTPSVRALNRDAADQPDWWLDRERKLGYLRMASMVSDGPGRVAKALRELQRGGARGLVLDLRDCAGGLLDAAVETADLFVDRGRLLSIHQRDQDQHFDAKRGGNTKLRLAVLVNAGTISSCEVLAGALADNPRATLFGERTYGKGRMQVIYTLGEGRGGMVMSTGTFQRPNGKTIDRHDVPEGSPDAGIAPDVVVKVSEAEHKAWLEHAEKTTGLILLTRSELGGAPPDPVLEHARKWLEER
jgi:carboxyl-terminal processing protease